MSDICVPKGFRLLIIGSGPTAIGVLHRIHALIEEGRLAQDHIQVIALEKEDEVGGLARSVTDDHGFTWDLGIHVIGKSRHREFELVVEKTVKTWNMIRLSVKADLSWLFGNDNAYDNYVPYPVQQSIPYFPSAVRQKCIAELRKLHEQSRKRDFENFSEYCGQTFGNTLVDIFIRPYNHKVWTVPLEEMNARWVAGRVPSIDLERIESQCGLNWKELDNEAQTMPVKCIRYPRDFKGIGMLWKLVSKIFPSEVFRFSTEVRKVDVSRKEVEATDECGKVHHYKYDCLLSTLPITELSRISGLFGDVNLKYSKIVLVGIGLQLPQTEWTQNVTWAYYPSPDTIFYRCTFPSNFNDYVTPDMDRYWSILCEISMTADAVYDENHVIESTIKGLKLKGVITDERSIVDKWSFVLPFGYPIPTVGRDEELSRCHALLQDHNLYSRGRFGGWKYEISDQDHCFMMGIEFAELLLFNKPETLYTL